MKSKMPEKYTKILLVEHNDFIRHALQKALEIEGFYVFSVRTALDGIKAAKKERFDIAVADYELPDTNGVEFFLLIHRLFPDIVNILMTTYGELKTLSDIFKYGIDDAIEKPFPFERLVVIIETALKKKNRRMKGTAGQ